MLRVGSECTAWNQQQQRWCGKATHYMRITEDGSGVESVLCQEHRLPGDMPIPSDAPREPRSTFWVDFKRRWGLA